MMGGGEELSIRVVYFLFFRAFGRVVLGGTLNPKP
jgi:hypothetical protein